MAIQRCLLMVRRNQRPPPFKKVMLDVAESAAALTLQERTIDHSPPSVQCYSASTGPTIWVRRPPGWHFFFCIRMDRERSFHMSPELGGPFQSLQEAEDAINNYVNGLPCPARCNEQDATSIEKQIKRILFYPDGTPKRGPNSPGKKNPNYRQRRLVQVLLEQYNDDHNLLGDRAHKLNGDVKFHWFDEAGRCYYHFNFMTKTEETGGACSLFFAELSQHKRDGDSIVSCCCIVKDNDNGLCYGCIRERSPEMKHPKNTDLYNGGHINYNYLTYGGDPCSDSDDDEETQVDKLWMFFEGRHAPPGVMDKIITWNQATSLEN